jgi:LCP family protein required for cell wall assembly
MRKPVAIAVAAGALLLGVIGIGVATVRASHDPVVVIGSTGRTTSTPPTEPPTVVTEPPTAPLPPPAAPIQAGPAVGVKVADGQPYPPAIPFVSTIVPVDDDLVFVLVLGSDARPREDLLHSRSDSIHLVAINTRTGQGTIVGFPRDSYVEFPRGGRGRINDAMARGGPQYAAETVRKLTGLPIHYYVVTGFVGLARMVDDLGGVDVLVDRRMNDRLSGARFQAGWHHFSGAQALAFSRNRHDVPDGDFTRSQHQGAVLLAALDKLRAEVGDDGGLFHWLEVLARSATLDVPADRLPRLAALARRMDPGRFANVVLPGRVGTGGGGASVVYLTRDAPALFNDLRDDAVIGAPAPVETPSTTSTSTSTSTSSVP